MSTRVPSITLVLSAVLVATLGLPATVVHADTIYVCWDGSGDYRTIQEGIDAAGDGDEVVVCDGTYTGEGNKDLDFHGKAITVRSENAPENCIIDCEGSEVDPHRGFHFHSGESADARLDGFTICSAYTERNGGGMLCQSSNPTVTNCRFNGNLAYWDGGGMCNENSSPTLVNCTFAGNSAERGGAVYNWDYSNPTLTDCTFTANSAGGGAGMYNSDGSSPTLTNCTFSANLGGCGGGMYNDGSSPTLTNCTFSENSVPAWGGGMCNAGSRPTLTNCTFSENSAAGGGGMYNHSSSPTLADCTFSGNAAYEAGGMHNSYDSNPTLTNCTFASNSVNQWGGGMYNTGGSSPSLTDCIFTANSAYWDGAGMRNDSSSPTVANCTFSGNSAASGAGMYNWNYSNPTVTNCTFSGNSAASMGDESTLSRGGGMYNVEGSPTVTNCTFSGNSVTATADHSAWSCGAGMCNLSGSSPTLTNCTFSGNLVTATADYHAWSYGAGMYNDGSSPTLTNCTFAGNSASSSHDACGGGMFNNGYASRATLANCILWDDNPDEIVDDGGARTTVSYSDVHGGWEGAGNIDADPLFVDPDGPDDDPNTWEDNDFHLSGGSPCIDAGCNWAVPPDTADLDDDGDTTEPTPLDLDGEGRFFDDPDMADTGCGCPPIVDMGAYEFGDAGPQPCPGDLDCDRVVGHSDLGIFLRAWHISDEGDLNCDGETDHADLGILLAHWGQDCP